MKQICFKYILYILLFLCLLNPIITTSLSMKTLKISSEPTRIGINDNMRIATSTDNTWTNVTTTGDKPSPRCFHSMVYDSKNDRIILFGGTELNSIKFFDDTWVYNYTDNTWTNVTNTMGDKPSPRAYHSMVYDTKNDRTILFGGYDNTDYYDDTWVYNYTDNTWTNVTIIMGDKPNPRECPSMAYDSAHNRVILFGGYAWIGAHIYFDDTWIFNLTDYSWTNVTTIMGDKPTKRSGHSMVYNSAHNQTILFGGSTLNGANYYFDDTWVYNYTDNIWTNVTTTMGDKPSPRAYHSMVYDTKNDRTILFGGYDPTGNKYFDDTWVYNLIDNSWTNITTASTKPYQRGYHSMVYDSAHNRVILFGGYAWIGGSYNFDDTWVYCFADIPSPPLPPAAGDDDDDEDDDEEPAIPGYNFYLILGLMFTCGLITIIIIKKKISS